MLMLQWFVTRCVHCFRGAADCMNSQEDVFVIQQELNVGVYIYLHDNKLGDECLRLCGGQSGTSPFPEIVQQV